MHYGLGRDATVMTFGSLPMKCLVCGSEMRLTLVESHEVTKPGFEYRTFQCESCGETERRFVFDPRPSLELFVTRAT
jgi:hypothetical protein